MKQLNLRLVVLTIFGLIGTISDGWAQDDATAVSYAESGVADSELLETDINSEGIEASVAVGFDGLRADDSITAISFRVKNTSSEFLSGRIEVEKIEWRRRQGILSMPIEVGQNSPRRFSMGVRLPYDGQLICRIVSGDKVLWQKTVLLQFGGRSSYENPLLVVSA